MIKPTRALRKIAALKKRIWVIQGGQGAGKTFAILLILINHAKSHNNKEIFIASKELSKMRITVIKDFVSIMRLLGLFERDCFVDGTLYRFRTGSFVKFIGLDKEDIGKGLRSDVVFINEANKVDFESYRELTSRAKRVILDFNPNSEFWAHEDVIKRDDCDFLTLTYQDNEFLSVHEVNEILLNKTRAFHNPDLDPYDFPTNVKSKYWRNKWNIYGLGLVGSNPNRIFEWEEIPDVDYLKLDATRYYAHDWGVVDPWGVLEAKYYDGALYFHELNYKSENQIREELTVHELEQINKEEEGLVKFILNRLAIDKKEVQICDTNRPMKISTLWSMGYRATGAPKPPGSIIDGINILCGLRCFFTASSHNLKYEQENYSRQVDRYGIVLEEPEDLFNHLMDPARYIALYLVLMGIIKR